MIDIPTRRGGGRWIAAVVLGAVFIAMMSVFVMASAAQDAVRANAGRYLLASPTGVPTADPAVAAKQAPLERALLFRPLDQGVVNAAVYAEISRTPSAASRKAKIGLLRRLGWRHTPALQNIMFAAAVDGSWREVVNVADALLRRSTLVDETTMVMNSTELFDESRGLLATKLAGNPPWRLAYLMKVDQLKDPDQLEARGALMLDLIRRMRSPVTRHELGSNVRQLVGAGSYASAYALWRTYRRTASLALNDPGFDWAYSMRSDQVGDMPFEWLLGSGAGYWVELDRSGSDALVRVHWDGRGVPDFLTQQTHLRPGRYRLSIRGIELPPTLLDNLAFGLRCPDATITLDRPISSSAAGIVVESDGDVPCASPQFVVSGRPRQAGRAAMGIGESYEITLTELRLQPAPRG